MVLVWFQWLFIWSRSWLKNVIDFAIGQGSKEVKMTMWCLLLMFLYTWFVEKLVCSDRSVVTEPWGTELVFFGWDPAQVTQSFCFVWKTLFPYVSYNPHISIDLISHCLPLVVKQFDCHMHGQVLCRRITASCVGVKCTDFQRIPPSFESACSKLIKCYRSTLESSQESQRF